MPLKQLGTDKLMIKKHIRLKNQKTKEHIKCLKRKGDKTQRNQGAQYCKLEEGEIMRQMLIFIIMYDCNFMQKRIATNIFFLFYFENMFITAGDSKVKEVLRIEESTGESQAGLLWLFRNFIGKRWATWAA